jgi:hypothetical protein
MIIMVKLKKAIAALTALGMIMPGSLTVFADETPAAEILIGDVNSDSNVDITDLSFISLFLLKDAEFTNAQQKAADTDGDGNVTLADLARIRQFISKKINRHEFCGITLTDIVNTAIRDNLPTSSAIEKFYEDIAYIYEFPSIESDLIECTFSDGTVMNVREALAEGVVSISDLDKYGISYFKKPKEKYELKARVSEIYDDGMLVIPEDKNITEDKVFIHCKQMITDLSIDVGDTVNIEYDGMVMTSYPAQIRALNISILKKTSLE